MRSQKSDGARKLRYANGCGKFDDSRNRRTALVARRGLCCGGSRLPEDTIMFYGTQILTEAGFGRQIAIIANVANGLTSVIATFFGIWLLGKIGRVTMFKAGILGTMGSLLIIALAAMNLEGSPALHRFVNDDSVSLVHAVFLRLRVRADDCFRVYSAVSKKLDETFFEEV